MSVGMPLRFRQRPAGRQRSCSRSAAAAAPPRLVRSRELRHRRVRRDSALASGSRGVSQHPARRPPPTAQLHLHGAAAGRHQSQYGASVPRRSHCGSRCAPRCRAPRSGRRSAPRRPSGEVSSGPQRGRVAWPVAGTAGPPRAPRRAERLAASRALPSDVEPGSGAGPGTAAGRRLASGAAARPGRHRPRRPRQAAAAPRARRQASPIMRRSWAHLPTARNADGGPKIATERRAHGHAARRHSRTTRAGSYPYE